MKEPEMKDMIADCESKRTPDEIICFAIGAGRILPKVGMRKAMKEANEYIQGLDGFVGFFPFDLWHTLIIFDTLNNAKAGKNLLKSKDISVGNVIPILVDKQYVKRGEK